MISSRPSSEHRWLCAESGHLYARYWIVLPKILNLWCFVGPLSSASSGIILCVSLGYIEKLERQVGKPMKRLTQLIPLSVMVVLLFVSVAAAQSIPDQSGGTANNSLVLIGFGPSGFGDITVDPGTTVRWINRDTKAHTVTADDGSFDSGVLEPGQAFSVTFNELGWWPYHSELDPGMTGSVGVGVDDEVVVPPPEEVANDPALMEDPALMAEDPALMEDPTLTDPTLMEDPGLTDPTLMAQDPALMDPTLEDPTLMEDPTQMDPTLTDPTLVNSGS